MTYSDALRTGTLPASVRLFAGGPGHGDFYAGAMAGRCGIAQSPADELCAVGHEAQSQSVMIGPRTLDPGAVVGHAQDQPVGLPAQFDGDVRGTGMTLRIGQRLEGDA